MLKKFKLVSMMLLCGAVTTEVAHATEVNTPMPAAQSQTASQSRSCLGEVQDEQGPIIGASVVVVGTNKGASTDMDGKFSIAGVKPGSTVRISYVGCVTQEVKWTGQPIKLTLKESSQSLDEVVVVGFGTQKKANLTGAVSAVSGKEIAARPVSSTIEALQGIVPGLNISTSSDGGSLKSDKSFNIRGKGTIGSGSSVSPLVLIDGMDGDLSTLNPQDIESLSVLKDASASSIYGSRAAGGVILVTTKKGRKGKTVVNYNDNFRFNSPLNMPHMADSWSFAVSINDQLSNGGGTPMYSEKKLQQILDYQQGKGGQYMWATSAGRWNSFDDANREDVMPAGNSDWLYEMFGSSFTQEHNMSVSGGTETVQYYLSANYLNNGGLFKHGEDGKQRYSFTGRINADLAKWLKIGYSVRFNRTDYTSPSFASAGWNPSNVLYFDVCRYWPVIPVVDPNGFYTTESKISQLEDGGQYKTQNDVLAQQLSLIIEPIKNWKTSVELNYRTNNNFSHTEWLTVYGHDVKGQPSFTIANSTSGVQEYAYKSNYFNPNIYTEYTQQFGDGHTLKAMVGMQTEWFKYRNITASGDGIISGLPTLSTTSSNPQVRGVYADWTTAGFFGRINYDYKNRYLVEVNLRYDGSSRFLRENRWNWFPSFSAGWNIAEENFFEACRPIVNTLKLRGTYGQLGNANTDSYYPFYRSLNYGSANGGWLVNGQKPNTASEGALVSSTLGWEKLRTVDFGIDLGLFKNRLNVNFDYFQRKTLDMVGPSEVMPTILGISVPKTNNLDMTSKGWELQVSWRDRIQEVSYGATLSLADSKTTIDKYPNPTKDLGQTYYDGACLGDLWGYKTIGIAKTDAEMQAHLATTDQSNLGSNWGAGDIMYEDVDGNNVISNKTNTLDDHGDKVLLGNNTPRYQFGLNLDAAWKGFDVKVFFQGVLKRDYMPDGGSTMFWGAVGYWQTNFFKEHLDYFRPEGTSNPLGANVDGYYPRPLENGRNRYSQSRYMQNASYCRLKNFTIGYTIPVNITQKFYVSNLRFFVSGENLLTMTKLSKMFDPETIGVGNWDGCTYPLSKSFSFGLSATF